MSDQSGRDAGNTNHQSHSQSSDNRDDENQHTSSSVDTETNSSLSRRGALAIVAGLSLVGAASEPAAAAKALEFGNNYSGSTPSGYGLKLSTDSKGVVGEASDSGTFTIGVEGRSAAKKGRGIAGFADHPSGEAYGVLGRTASTGGNGVYGYSTATSGDTRGVLGISKSPAGTAVLGYNPASSETAYAGRFESNSSEAVALLGKANASSGMAHGVKGVTQSPDGYGLYTPDNAKIEGNLEVSGTKHFAQTVQTDTGSKEVFYTAVESGRAHTEVNEIGQMEDGQAVVELPNHFNMVTNSEEPLNIQITPYAKEQVSPQVVDYSTDAIVVKDFSDGPGEYSFACTVKGIRDGFEENEIIRENK